MNDAPHFDLADPDAEAFCPECSAGYRAGARSCSDCGVPLLSRAEAEALSAQRAAEAQEQEPDYPDSPVSVNEGPALLLETRDLLKASALSDRLLETRIGFSAVPHGLLGSTPSDQSIAFLVSVEDLERAKDVLREVDESLALPPEPAAD